MFISHPREASVHERLTLTTVKQWEVGSTIEQVASEGYQVKSSQLKARQDKAERNEQKTQTDTRESNATISYNCQQVYLCDSRSSWPGFQALPFPVLHALKLVPGFGPLAFSGSH